MEVGESSTWSARQNKRKREHPFHGITPQAAAPSWPVMKKGPWDVFINHRGCDTKHKLASTIYHTLDLIGIHAFLDVEELELADSIPEEIKEAMRTARLHIAIFSKSYAESPWCLAELSRMLETGTPIVPVFYHVEPNDLRWVAQEKGLYAPAFSQYKDKGRYPTSKLEEWIMALERVSNLSGYVLNDNHGDEGMLLKSVVNSVLKVIRKEPLEVAKHPVGMEQIVEDFEKNRQEHIEKEQQAIQIVGIVGLGGSGKTTLATELYNREISSFSSSSFLYDVRASKNALHTKQKKLLEDLHIQADQFDNQKDGKRILAKRLKSIRGLIVLDDVDHEDQLDALLPAKEDLGSGSLVIVTTRDGDVLAKSGVTFIYKMQPLRSPVAKQLFCWHAFLQPSPQQGFEELVESFIDVCQGLPLSLKVIGGQLYGRKSKDYWLSQLDKIRRILPKEVKERLKVSYDALDEEEKEVFLDIACFFIDERPSLAIAVWDGSGWSGVCSWETLHNKCLVEVVEVEGEECIRMHDHLRDLGREIAESQPTSRIWSKRQSMHIQRGMPIRGIMDATAKNWTDRFSRLDIPLPLTEYMEMMRISNVRVGLDLLVVAENNFSEECGELSRGLVWLRWAGFSHRCIPSWLSLDNIRVLEIIYPSRDLETLWDDAAHPPLQLRELRIHDPWNLRSLPRSIGNLKHLKRLSLVREYFGAMQLSSLPEEFCRLQSLEHLDIVYSDLRSLPSNFGDLVKLRHISLRESDHLEMLPKSFKQLIHLEYIDLGGCSSLTLESDILDNMRKLKVFNVPFCQKLQGLPHNITNQASLRNLNFRETRSLRELPESFGQLSKLEELLIDDCPLLTRLPASLGDLCSLSTLTILHCEKLSELPSLASLVSLKTLRVCDCPQIMKIEGLEHLTSLEKLVVSTNGTLSGIHSLSGTERLQKVNLQAGNISTFEACIQSIEIEKWPWEMTVCGRIFPGVASIFDSFTLPGLAMVDSFYHPISNLENSTEETNINLDPYWHSESSRDQETIFDPISHTKSSRGEEKNLDPIKWCLTCPETDLSNAAIVCFLVPSLESSCVTASEDSYDRSLLFHGSSGEWIVMSVSTDVAPLLEEGWVYHASITPNLGEPFGGWLVVGDKSSVVNGFKQILQTLSPSQQV